MVYPYIVSSITTDQSTNTERQPKIFLKGEKACRRKYIPTFVKTNIPKCNSVCECGWLPMGNGHGGEKGNLTFYCKLFFMKFLIQICITLIIKQPQTTKKSERKRDAVMVDTCLDLLSKPTECTSPRVNSNASYGLQLIIQQIYQTKARC